MNPSRVPPRALPLLAALVLGTATSHATLHWIGDLNGGDGSSTYQEANWDTDGDPSAPHTAPAADTVNPATSIDEDIFVTAGTPGGVNGAGGNFDIGNSGSLTLSGGTFRMAAGSGIRADGTAGGVKTIITMSNDTAIFCQFFLDQTISVSGSASLTLFGGGNPINVSTIDFDPAWTGTLTFNAETTAAVVSEHLSKLTVGGEAAVTGSDPGVLEPGDNVVIVDSGGSGSVLTVGDPPPQTLALSACHATPTAIRTSGTVRVHWRSAAADTIVVNDGTSDVDTFTSEADGQELIDAGFIELPVSADTTFTVTASNTTESVNSMTSVEVLSGADPATYAEAVLADTPVAFWQFEEAVGSSAIFDSANNSHDSKEVIGGVALGAPGAISNAMNNAGSGAIVVDLQLNPQDPDGDDDIDDADPDSTEGWSIEAIVRPDSATTTNDQHIASNRDGSGTGRSNLFIDQDGTLQSFVGGVGRLGVNPLADASWTHAVMTVALDPDAADPLAPYTLRYYINGVLDTEIPDVPIEAADGDWVLASHKNLVVNGFLVGSLDEVSIYDTTLDQATITAHYEAFIADPDVAPLLGFDAIAESVTQGSSTSLFWKLGGTATTAVITDDQGGTIVADAITTSEVIVSPAVDTVYTLTVNGTGTEIATTTITVNIPILVTAAGINANGFFEMTVRNLEEGLTYDLYYSLDLVIWTSIGVPQTADATGILTFIDTIAVDPANDSALYYRVGLAP